MRKTALASFILLLWISTAAIAQDTLKIPKSKLDSLNIRLDNLTHKAVRAGISLAYRQISNKFDRSYQSASISPIDSTLRLETMDKNSFILSTSIVITPFIKTTWIQSIANNCRMRVTDKTKKAGKRFGSALAVAGLYIIENIGITANINLLEFAGADKGGTFNKSLEGGLGLCLRASERIYLSYASDVLFSRQLRDDIKAQEGKKIYSNGKVISSIDELESNNSNYWITKNVIGRNVRVIILF